MLMLQTTKYMSDQVVKAADAINATWSIQEKLLQRNSAVASEILTAENATAETIENKAKARLKRVEIIKKPLTATGEAMEWLSIATRDCVAEYDRIYLKARPEAHEKISKSLVSIGFTEDAAIELAGYHPILCTLTMEIRDTQIFQNGTIGEWRKLIHAEKLSLETELQKAIRKIC